MVEEHDTYVTTHVVLKENSIIISWKLWKELCSAYNKKYLYSALSCVTQSDVTQNK